MTDDTAAPIYQPSAEALAGSGLRMQLVDTADERLYDPWHVVVGRGFHGGLEDDAVRERSRAAMANRRTTGVYDDGTHDPLQPVGTANSWRARLTVPGERTVDGWAISCVTVAPTHRRRGIARALLEAELGTAAGLGIPLAMLTVSESSIYGRFGFAPAAMAADWSIDTSRARWIGPEPAGRVDFITVPEWRELIPAVHEIARLQSPGEIQMWGGRWDQLAGTLGDDEGYAKRLRAIQYRNDAGEVRGLALFRISGGDMDFTEHRISVEALVSTDPDSYAALWRFLLTMDLVAGVDAELRSVDEPLRWMIADWRGAVVKTWEHQYLRVLDVVGAFQGRAYANDGSVAFSVVDPLGYAAGAWVLSVRDGEAVVTKVDEVPADVPALALGVDALSALYLGGVSAPTLVAAGRVRETRPGAAAAVDALLHSPVVPWLSRWY